MSDHVPEGHAVIDGQVVKVDRPRGDAAVGKGDRFTEAWWLPDTGTFRVCIDGDAPDRAQPLYRLVRPDPQGEPG